jgi:hypothetical protein
MVFLSPSTQMPGQCLDYVMTVSFQILSNSLFTNHPTGLDGREVGVRVPVGARFLVLHVIQTGSGAQPASHLMGTGGLFPRE